MPNFVKRWTSGQRSPVLLQVCRGTLVHVRLRRLGGAGSETYKPGPAPGAGLRPHLVYEPRIASGDASELPDGALVGAPFDATPAALVDVIRVGWPFWVPYAGIGDLSLDGGGGVEYEVLFRTVRCAPRPAQGPVLPLHDVRPAAPVQLPGNVWALEAPRRCVLLVTAPGGGAMSLELEPGGRYPLGDFGGGTVEADPTSPNPTEPLVLAHVWL